MRKLAMMLLLTTGCAAAPALEPDEIPRRAPEAERVSEEEVVGGDEVGGAGSACGDPASTSADGVTPDVGFAGDSSSGDEVVASWLPTLGDACHAACVTLTSGGCIEMTYVCGAAEVVTVGGASIPCVFALAAACSAMLAMPLACAGICQYAP